MITSAKQNSPTHVRTTHQPLVLLSGWNPPRFVLAGAGALGHRRRRLGGAGRRELPGRPYFARTNFELFIPFDFDFDFDDIFCTCVFFGLGSLTEKKSQKRDRKKSVAPVFSHSTEWFSSCQAHLSGSDICCSMVHPRIFEMKIQSSKKGVCRKCECTTGWVIHLLYFFCYPSKTMVIHLLLYFFCYPSKTIPWSELQATGERRGTESREQRRDHTR